MNVEEGWKHVLFPLLVTHIRRRSSGDVIICRHGSWSGPVWLWGQVDRFVVADQWRLWEGQGLMKRVGRCAARPVGKPQLFIPLIPTVWLREEIPHRAHAYSIIDPVNRPYASLQWTEEGETDDVVEGVKDLFICLNQVWKTTWGMRLLKSISNEPSLLS